MDNAVRSFNGLRRPKTTPTGLPNHWVFGVRETPFTPPGDMVLAVNPQSRFLLTGGPRQILSKSTISEKAEAVIRLLLDIFIKGVDPESRYSNVPPPFAPWTWVAEDPELGAAIEEGLKQHGVKKELCRVGTCSAEEKLILEESHASLLEKMCESMGITLEDVPLGDASKCHGCGKNSEDFSTPLKKCAACQKAWYHSQDCQKYHWREHKPACLANRPSKSTSAKPTAGNSTSASSVTAN